VLQIADGTGNTYLAGEKYLQPDLYEDCINAEGYSKDEGDNKAIMVGDTSDFIRWTTFSDETVKNLQPTRDTLGLGGNLYHAFGSPHADAFNMVFCDGSVRQISYGVKPSIHAYLSSIDDGQTTDINQLEQY
jgi:prepilin-type processing-associated H-X9-DG protein